MIMNWAVFILTLGKILAKKRYNVMIMEESSPDDLHVMAKSGHRKHPKIKKIDYESIIDILSPDDSVVEKNCLGLTLDLTEHSYRKIKNHKKVLHIEEDIIMKIEYVEESIKRSNDTDVLEASCYEQKDCKGPRKQIDFQEEYDGIYNDQHHNKRTELYQNESENLCDTKALLKSDVISLLFRFYPTDSWALKKISGNKFGYEYIEDGGKNVLIYVLDTGVDVENPEFEGRASFGYNAVKKSPNTDQQGHGTHVAGIIGSKTFGISKKSEIIAVKVLDENGSGSVSRIIEGIEFVIRDFFQRSFETNDFDSDQENEIINYNNDMAKTKNLDYFKNNLYFINGMNSLFEDEKAHYKNFNDFNDQMTKNSNLGFNPFERSAININNGTSRKSYYNKKKAIINLSVGGRKSLVLNYFIKKTSENFNIFFSVAAGNEESNACAYSPSSSEYTITVAATDKDDKPARFSNIGRCVDIYAPGVEIKSLWLNNSTKTLSGTSMATPFVSGVASVYISLAEFEFSELKDKLIDDSDLIIRGPGTHIFFSLKLPLCTLKKLYNRIKKNRRLE